MSGKYHATKPSMIPSKQVIPKNYPSVAVCAGKKIIVYRNGDPFHKGLKLVINPNRMINLNMLLDAITEKVDLPYGAKRLFTIDGRLVKSINDIECGAEYVASSSSFSLVRYGKNPLIARGSSLGNVAQKQPLRISKSNEPRLSLSPSHSHRRSSSTNLRNKKGNNIREEIAKKGARRKSLRKMNGSDAETESSEPKSGTSLPPMAVGRKLKKPKSGSKALETRNSSDTGVRDSEGTSRSGTASTIVSSRVNVNPDSKRTTSPPSVTKETTETEITKKTSDQDISPKSVSSDTKPNANDKIKEKNEDIEEDDEDDDEEEDEDESEEDEEQEESETINLADKTSKDLKPGSLKNQTESVGKQPSTGQTAAEYSAMMPSQQRTDNSAQEAILKRRDSKKAEVVESSRTKEEYGKTNGDLIGGTNVNNTRMNGNQNEKNEEKKTEKELKKQNSQKGETNRNLQTSEATTSSKDSTSAFDIMTLG
ncbi:hypothetical protein AB6A40_002834 [Gnathostoma spinigerum]|uniref:Doublecortin domain-containing protein n=1 Tax=Gnathostoma spinigerum TaxID=75299 RepID=A0ABD6EIJ8_9BILA